ncbi:MAG: methyl-accepting chemotaxis protein [Thermodesulforhabdaceae bacterium]
MKPMSLRQKLLIAGILCIAVPLVVLSIFTYSKAKSESTKSAEANAINTSRIIALAVKDILTGNLQTLQGFSLNPIVVKTVQGDSENVGKANDLLKEFNKKLGEIYEVIFIADLSGNIIADSTDGGYKGINVADREYWKKAAQGTPNVGDMIISKKTQQPVLPLGCPVVDEHGKVVGVVSGALKADSIINIVTKFKLSDTSYSFMLDHAGTVIAHPDKSLIMKLNAKQTQGLEDLGNKMTGGQEGLVRYVFKGTEKIAAYTPVGINGWSVATTQNIFEFMKTATAIRNSTIIVAVLFLLIGVVAIYFLATSIAKPIFRISRGLMEGADQVATAAEEVSASSQSLAEGASEQAASIEETSSALEELASMTRQNAANAEQSASLMRHTVQAVDEAHRAMNQIGQAMAEIARASDETQKIIKTIDEIAFQTNLLALNAAVEAARAGEAGAGFAVVADEVRSLAIRAAEAAKNTASLIEQTANRVREGVQVVERATQAFSEVKESTAKVGNLIQEVSEASREQTEGIEQINKAVSELDKVVQRNAATAEEAAAASEELNAQAFQMRDYVSQLMVIVGGRTNGSIKVSSMAVSKNGTEKVSAVTKLLAKKKESPKLAVKTSESGGKEVSPESVIPLDDDF